LYLGELARRLVDVHRFGRVPELPIGGDHLRQQRAGGGLRGQLIGGQVELGLPQRRQAEIGADTAQQRLRCRQAPDQRVTGAAGAEQSLLLERRARRALARQRRREHGAIGERLGDTGSDIDGLAAANARRWRGGLRAVHVERRPKQRRCPRVRVGGAGVEDGRVQRFFRAHIVATLLRSQQRHVQRRIVLHGHRHDVLLGQGARLLR
jgi:hypothetical protein